MKKSRPILFSTPMVNALPPKGLKTNTRRTKGLEWINQNPDRWEYNGNHTENYGNDIWFSFSAKNNLDLGTFQCPYGQRGDRLWVKETHYAFGSWVKNGLTKKGKQKWRFDFQDNEIKYLDNPPELILKNTSRNEVGWFKRSSLFMPKWASRITLEITQDPYPDRLQDISEEDAIAEGIQKTIQLEKNFIKTEQLYKHYTDPSFDGCDAMSSFRTLWVSINKQSWWDSNPWVWVVKFKRVMMKI